MTDNNHSERMGILLKLRRYSEGEKVAREALAQWPDWGVAYTFLAQFVLFQKRGKEAIEAARTGIAKAPHDAWAHAILGLVYEHLGRPTEAVKAAREAIRLMPNYEYAYSILSYNLSSQERHAEAVDATSEGLRHCPDDEPLLRHRAFALYKLDRLEEARDVCLAGLKQHAQSGGLFNALALVHFREGQRLKGKAKFDKHLEADRLFLEAIRTDPNEKHYHGNSDMNVEESRAYFRFSGLWFLAFFSGLAAVVLLILTPILTPPKTDDRVALWVFCLIGLGLGGVVGYWRLEPWLRRPRAPWTGAEKRLGLGFVRTGFWLAATFTIVPLVLALVGLLSR